MRKTAQRSLQASQNYGYLPISLAYSVCINYNGSVGTFACDTSGRIHIRASFLLVYGVVIHHRIEVARIYEKSDFWSAEAHKIVLRLIIGLCENSNIETRFLQNSRNYRRTERRVVYVCVARNKNKVGRAPKAFFTFFFCNR